MRYDADHKARTRERLLKAASATMRADGPHKLALAGVMAKAGLTHGGFYAHFASRDDLVAATIERMFDQGGSRFALETSERTPAEGLAHYIDFYLSAAHRDTRGAGCPLPYLAADAPRLPAASRARFADGVANLTARLCGLLHQLGAHDPQTAAASLLAELVGALSLARAEPDLARSDTILSRSKRALKMRLLGKTFDDDH